MASVDPLTGALRYAENGWPVLPCHSPTRFGCSCSLTDCSSPGKHPRLSNGLTGASTDPYTIERWWHRWPTANIAIRTGEPSGLVVVDVDRRAGGHRTLSELVERHGVLPATMTVRTGDGIHLYFAHPGRAVSNDAGRRVGAGIDIRGDGGYVLAPPSLHHTGRRYAVEAERAIAPMPEWIRELVAPTPPVRATVPRASVSRDGSAWARAALENEIAAVGRAHVGTRNATLNRAAFSLGQIVAGGELELGGVEASLLAAAQAAGLGEHEARATINSGVRAGAETPRTPPEIEHRGRHERLVMQRPANEVTFVPWPKDFEGPSCSARSEYVERCWTSVLGPTAVLALRAINHELEVAGGCAHVDVEDLGRSLGVGATNGKNSTMQRTLARLESFNVAVALPDGSMAIRADLPLLSNAQLRRAGPGVQQWHRNLCPDLAAGPTLSR